ncbi:hypothetical protein JCM3766R1_004218 [Sporobolomyces carnicolor]
MAPPRRTPKPTGEADDESKYTAPRVFRELEQDFKRQRRLLKKNDKKRTTQAAADDGSDFDQLASDVDDSGYLSDRRGANKKRKKTTSKKKKQAAKGSVKRRDRFSELPDELILEIFSHVDDLETLYHLSLVSTKLNNLSSPAEYWSSLRTDLDPPVPDVHGFTEQQFAHLLYGKTCWMLRSSLEDEADELLTREQKDLDDAETAIWNAIEERKQTKKGPIVDNFEEKGPKAGSGKRVRRYLERRKRLKEVYEREGQELYDYLQEKKHDALDEKARIARERRQDFKSDYWKKHHLITTGPAEIDDATWDELEPKVVKVVKHCRELKQKAAGEARIQGRLDFLREKMYDKRRADATEFPLFADFCLFPSVLKLLDLEDTTYEQLSMKRLKESKSAIYEEVEEWTEKNRLEAVKLILSRTLEADEFGVLDDEDFQVYADDEAWFENVQTFVFCDVSGCATSSPYRQLFFGSYDALLAHQHEVHGDLKPKFSKQATQKKKKKQDGRFEVRFSLPRVVSDSLAELLDMLEFEPDDSDGICRVTEKGLSRIFVGGTTLQWENAPRVGFGKSKKDTDWGKIMTKIKVEGDRARKQKQTIVPSLVIWDTVQGKPKKRKKKVVAGETSRHDKGKKQQNKKKKQGKTK